MPVKFWHTIVRFQFFLSYLITTVNMICYPHFCWTWSGLALLFELKKAYMYSETELYDLHIPYICIPWRTSAVLCPYGTIHTLRSTCKEVRKDPSCSCLSSMLYLLTCRAGLDWSYEFPDRTRPDRTGQDWRVLHWDVYKDSGFILNLQKFCKFYSTKFICLKLLVIKKVLNYLEVNMYLLPHFMASMNKKKLEKFWKNLDFFPFFYF